MDWIDANRFQIDEIRFHTYALEHNSEPAGNELLIGKSPASVEAFADDLAEFRGGNIVELGVFRGGSAAFIALVAEPRKLVTVDLEPVPAKSLESFVTQRGLDHTVACHWGVDQADQPRLRAIAIQEFGDEPIDLVVDDASHKLFETRASFDVLFPLLRPEGLYIIEDWRWDIALHERLSRVLRDPTSEQYAATRSAVASALADPSSSVHASIAEMTRLASEDASAPWHHAAIALLGDRDTAHGPTADLGREGEDAALRPWRPMARLIVELLFAQASTDDVVREVSVRSDAIAVRRGSAAVDTSAFQLVELSVNHFALL